MAMSECLRQDWKQIWHPFNIYFHVQSAHYRHKIYFTLYENAQKFSILIEKNQNILQGGLDTAHSPHRCIRRMVPEKKSWLSSWKLSQCILFYIVRCRDYVVHNRWQLRYVLLHCFITVLAVEYFSPLRMAVAKFQNISVWYNLKQYNASYVETYAGWAKQPDCFSKVDIEQRSIYQTVWYFIRSKRIVAELYTMVYCISLYSYILCAISV